MNNTVLIVDDSPDDMEITKRILKKAGIALQIKETLSGESALALLRKWSALPRLILLDLKMPGMNGIETLREIRQDDRLKQIPVVMLTNSTLDSDKLEAHNAGANAYLHKAFDIDQFRGELQFALKQWLTP
jgi:two-component system response regulator